ncbi:MAG: hypothetical protein BRD50_02825 [Bacteroidetes bacterium SW_11_45_7]|nr:MAG: hypothetical protein BRD50_02825 [Bacteroidetes bacterium SW_11_45_7]
METGTKINQLLKEIPSGAAILSKWLVAKGYSYALQQKYKQNGWLETVARGVMKRAGDQVGWEGGLFALQYQAQTPVHIGGISALRLHGAAQYIPFGKAPLHLFLPHVTKIPAWFFEIDNVPVTLHHTDFLPRELGLKAIEDKTLTLITSAPARAFLELLYLAEEDHDWIEAYEIIENLTTLRPATVQELLELCNSVKVKRAFLYLAHLSGHTWFKYLDLKRIKLGKGKRKLVDNGKFMPEFQITVPKTLTK